MKYLIILVVLIVLGIGAYWVLGGPAEAPITPTEEPAAQDETQQGEGTTIVVTYTDQGFSPSTVTVRVGDTVRFVNQGTLEMWVGSDDHPDHTNYSGTERKDHCPAGSTTAFDQCSVGTEYSFTFTKAGTWGYHNHRVEEDTGTVIVE